MKELLPELSFGVAHGRMGTKDLEETIAEQADKIKVLESYIAKLEVWPCGFLEPCVASS